MNPAILYIVGGFLIGVFGGTWKPFLGFKKPPPTAEVTKLQADLTAAQAAAQQAEKDRDAAKIAERIKLEAQVRGAQEDNAGTQAALKKVPMDHKSAEVKLAEGMALRVDIKLATAIGELNPADRQAMVQLIEDALAGKQAEFDAAMAKRDADFKALSGERDQLKAQIPILSEKAAQAEKSASNVQDKLTIKVAEVNDWAAKTDAAERKAGSLFGALDKVWRYIYIGAGLWVFLAFVIPGIVKHLQSGQIKDLLRDCSGYALNPLLHHDARTKLADLQQNNPPKT